MVAKVTTKGDAFQADRTRPGRLQWNTALSAMPAASVESRVGMDLIETDVEVVASDGYVLAATEFRQATERARGSVVVAPATGVRRSYYASFARFLAGRRFDVVTWDWRGTGDSRRDKGQCIDETMLDWGRRDLVAMIGLASAEGREVFAVGHSFGGQAFGLAPNGDRIARAVTVAAQNGYWRYWPFPSRYAYALLWYAAAPLLTSLLGRFPLRLAGGENLPSGVALQWAKWNRTPDYFGDWSGHARLKTPILAISLEDDPYAPRAAVDALHVRYGGEVERLHVDLRTDGRRIGHWGFFREGVAPDLWERAAGWLERPGESGPAA